MRKGAVAAGLALAACNARATPLGLGGALQDQIVAAPEASARMMVRDGGYAEAENALAPEMSPRVLGQLTAGKRQQIVELYALAAFYAGDAAEAAAGGGYHSQGMSLFVRAR